jgi:hypothetical protein
VERGRESLPPAAQGTRAALSASRDRGRTPHRHSSASDTSPQRGRSVVLHRNRLKALRNVVPRVVHERTDGVVQGFVARIGVQEGL